MLRVTILAVVEIHDRGEVQLLTFDVELGHVSHPFLVWACRIELSCKDVGCDLPHLALIGTVLLQSNAGLQLQLIHESLHCLVVDRSTLPTQHRCDASIAVPALVFVVNRLDLFFDGSVLVGDLQCFLLVVKGA